MSVSLGDEVFVVINFLRANQFKLASLYKTIHCAI